MNTQNYFVSKLSWTGRVAETLREVYGQSCSPATLFIERAREVLVKTKVCGPPFDPFQYAKELGIQVVEKDDMILDGILQLSSDEQFVVHLKRKVTPSRKNFTLAHEIAHTFFYDLMNHPAHFRGGISFDPEEERLCDMAAAELLMPEATFKTDLLLNRPLTPETLFWLVARYNVSLQAAATRIASITRKYACVIWKQEFGMFTVEYATPWFMRRAFMCQTGRSSLELAMKKPNKTVTLNDSYYGRNWDGLMRARTATVRLDNNRALSVIRLSNSFLDKRRKLHKKRIP